MPSTFYTVITKAGQAKIANAGALGGSVSLSHMAVGDGNGNPTTPSENQTSLIRERFRAPINELNVDPNNPNYMYADFVVPTTEGGWTIHEVGLFANDGTLFAVANFPATYKPILSEGSGRELLVRIYIQVGNDAAVTLQIDPTVVLASRQWVHDNYSIAAQIPGGLTGQILRKKTNNDGDVEWFDPASGFAVYVEVLEEHQTLAESQTIVDLATVTTDGLAVYIDGLRTFDFAVLSPTRIQLNTSYPNGTKIDFVQNDPTAETQDIDLRVNRTILDAGLSINPADDTQLTTAINTIIGNKGFPGEGFGCRLSNNASDPNNSIDITSGCWMDSTNAVRIFSSSGFTKKLDSAFAEGTNKGGLFTGTKATSTAYHVFIIMKANKQVDFGFDTTLNAANRPAQFPFFRRIGTIFTNSSGNIIGFRQIGDYFRFKESVDMGATLTSSPANYVIMVPPGVEVLADVQVGGTATATSAGLEFCASHPLDTPQSLARIGVNGANAISHYPTIPVLTDTNRQIRCCLLGTGSISSTFLRTIGYRDDRGKVY